ncbi:hypothetical protein J6590_005756 [Homalodisca vitripennis]|nr:hypothetical protein J6590_005756 [Homalodisca vitripennis]
MPVNTKCRQLNIAAQIASSTPAIPAPRCGALRLVSFRLLVLFTKTVAGWVPDKPSFHSGFPGIFAELSRPSELNGGSYITAEGQTKTGNVGEPLQGLCREFSGGSYVSTLIA